MTFIPTDSGEREGGSLQKIIGGGGGGLSPRNAKSGIGHRRLPAKCYTIQYVFNLTSKYFLLSIQVAKPANKKINACTSHV